MPYKDFDPDVMQKIVECDERERKRTIDSEVIFPRGMYQCLRWAYAMEGTSPRSSSPLAKMQERMGDGKIIPFSVRGIKLHGLSPLEQYGMAQSIRIWVQEGLRFEEWDDIEGLPLAIIWAKYAEDSTHEKLAGRVAATGYLAEKLRRDNKIVAECVNSLTCNEFEKRRSYRSLGREHGVDYRIVMRTMESTKKTMRTIEDEAFSLLTPEFVRRGLIPRVQEEDFPEKWNSPE